MNGWSNGNSFDAFSDGHSMNVSPARPREPWIIRLLGPMQDRRGL